MKKEMKWFEFHRYGLEIAATNKNALETQKVSRAHGYWGG